MALYSLRMRADPRTSYLSCELSSRLPCNLNDLSDADIDFIIYALDEYRMLAKSSEDASKLAEIVEYYEIYSAMRL